MNNNETAAKIVERMLEEMNKNNGVLPWVKPWENKPTVKHIDGYTTIEVPCKAWSRTGSPYHGINTLLLEMCGKRGEMITFNQCKADGGKIKKGAKGCPIVFWSMFKKETDEVDEDGNKRILMIPTLKYYTVFSIDDCENIKQKNEQPAPEVIKIPKFHYEPVDGIEDAEYNDAAEAIIANYIERAKTLTLECKGNSDEAFYAPALDCVTVPNITQFAKIEEYYSTLFHELGHSTGHKDRLNRFTGKAANAAFGSQEYSKEELVAEITAATILNTLGLESGNSFRNSAAYVQNWSKHIKEDPMMFVSAAGKADKAVNMILGIDGIETNDGGDNSPRKVEKSVEEKPVEVKEEKPVKKATKARLNASERVFAAYQKSVVKSAEKELTHANFITARHGKVNIDGKNAIAITLDGFTAVFVPEALYICESVFAGQDEMKMQSFVNGASDRLVVIDHEEINNNRNAIVFKAADGEQIFVDKKYFKPFAKNSDKYIYTCSKCNAPVYIHAVNDITGAITLIGLVMPFKAQ